MNKDDLIKKLENLDIPEVKLPSHQRQLKMALLNSGYWKGETTTMSLLKKQIVPVGGIAAIIAIIAMSNFIFKTAPPVSAQETVRKTYEAFEELTNEEKQALEGQVEADLQALLIDAQNAADLIEIPYSQVESLFYSDKLDDETQRENLELKQRLAGLNLELEKAKYLKFTDSNGEKIILGISRDNLPVFCASGFSGPK